jgi:hypothetical protein
MGGMEVGSIAVGAWVARLVFAGLVLAAVIQGRYRVAGIAVVLGLIGVFGVPRLNPLLVTSYLAIVDIGLVFTVLGRDVRLN